MGYPTSSATEVLWLPGNGRVTVTVVHVSPGAPPSRVAEEILAATLEDVEEYITPVLRSIFGDEDEDELDDEEPNEEQWSGEGTDVTCEKRYGVKEGDVTIRVIVEFPEVEFSSHSVTQLLDYIVSVNGRAYQRSWMLLDPENWEMHRAIDAASISEPEPTGSPAEINIDADDEGSMIAILPHVHNITPVTPPENFLWN
jgi:hypothetical protein